MQNISLYENGNGGAVEFKRNNIQLTNSLYTAIYIKLFGGNIGSSTELNRIAGEYTKGWWGNKVSDGKENWINSETERTLRGIDTTPRSLQKIKNSAEKDLESLSKFGDITVEVSMPQLNRVSINIQVKEIIGESSITFTWDSMRKEVIEQILL